MTLVIATLACALSMQSLTASTTMDSCIAKNAIAEILGWIWLPDGLASRNRGTVWFRIAFNVKSANKAFIGQLAIPHA